MMSFFPVADSTYDLLENLLTWSKFHKENILPVFEVLNLRDVVSKSIEHTQQQAKSKSIVIINNVTDLIVRSDVNMLLSIFRNILSNSPTVKALSFSTNLSRRIKSFSLLQIMVWVCRSKFSRNFLRILKKFKLPVRWGKKGVVWA